MEHAPQPPSFESGDPEIAALLDFEPVHRRTRRHDGWSPERQRDFIAALAICGDVGRAADSVGRTYAGAWKLKTSGGAESFHAAWHAAIDLFFERNPQAARTGRHRPSAPPPPPPPPPPAPDPDAEERAVLDLMAKLLEKYLIKIQQERTARLAGRIIEADFYVRQMTWLEVVFDLGGHTQEVLATLRRNGRQAREIVATPRSVLLDKARRRMWQEAGEPERPPMPALGMLDDGIALGEPMECHYQAARDGPYKVWQQRREEQTALAAEAQRLWEEKARAEAAAWRERRDALGSAPPP